MKKQVPESPKGAKQHQIKQHQTKHDQIKQHKIKQHQITLWYMTDDPGIVTGSAMYPWEHVSDIQSIKGCTHVKVADFDNILGEAV